MNNLGLNGKLNILVVDDEPDMVSTLHDLLAGEGHRVDTALSGMEALHKIADKEYELVLTDLSMPHMDGVQLLKETKSQSPNTQVMIVTGYGTVESAVEAMRNGAMHYLIKPVEPRELILSLDRIPKRSNGTNGEQKKSSFHGIIGRTPCM
ncbi:response regulator, partial [bacterium]|nr:response regulator [bacterium]